jgi:hypothetical protein
MIIDKSDKIRQREDFIKKYKAALAAKLSKEQLATYLNIKPDSIVRRRLVIQETIGLALPYLHSGPSEIPDDLLRKYRAELGKLTKEDKKILIENETRTDRYDFSKYDRLVVTSAQNATPIHDGFFAALLTYCKANNAKLIVIPYRYKNPTSIFSDKEFEWWEPKLAKYMYEDQFKVSKHLQILGHIKKQPTAIQPLYGLEGQTGLDSAIVGHPKIQLKAIPTPAQELPKLLVSTGAVTLPNYTDSGAGWRGLFHHSYGAVVVELDRKNDIFHLRHIHGDRESGSFYDLNKFYTAFDVQDSPRASVLVTGDTHAVFMDPEVEKATYTNRDSIVNVLNPENLILHDVLDGYSISHHHRHNDIVKYGKHHFQRGNIEKELQITADFIDRVSREGMKTFIVKSNHDEHFDRWLQEAEPKDDPENARFYHYMKYHMFAAVKPTHTGFSTIDPFVFWCNNPDRERGLINKHLVNILARDESLFVNNIEFSFHGDKGAGGARGSLLGFSKVGPKLVIGHSHTPGIYEGVYQVGVSSYLDLEYKTGCDSWLHTHCIVYPDGKRTLINIIKGKWKL